MGCGESKHAVATTEPISSSKRWRSFSRNPSKISETKDNENVANDSTWESKGQEVEKETNKDVQVKDNESSSEKFSVNEAKYGDQSPPNTSIVEPILNDKEEEEEEKEISGGSESTQTEKEQDTENSGLENENEEAKEGNEEESTPRAEKEKNILTAMDETTGSTEN